MAKANTTKRNGHKADHAPAAVEKLTGASRRFTVSQADELVGLDADQFVALVRRLRPARRIQSIHLHYTVRPRTATYAGSASIRNMLQWQAGLGFSSPCQHLTVAPDGRIWTGRNWDSPPASVPGLNGNDVAGPLAIAIVGDFGTAGGETLAGPQRAALVRALAALVRAFELSPRDLYWAPHLTHPPLADGEIEFEVLREDVFLSKDELKTDAPADKDEPFPDAVAADPAVVAALDALSNSFDTNTSASHDGDTFPHYGIDRGAAEILDASPVDMPAAFTPAVARGGGAGDAIAITPQLLDRLRPHVVNFTAGQFSGDGVYQSTPEDVDQIFDTHLPAWWAMHRASTDKLRIVLFAHGGLVGEEAGLRIAAKHVEWWKANNVYPIYFVWETGFWQTIGQLISGAARRAPATRDLFDYTTDPAVELLARSLGGVKIWGGMKHSARLAFDPGGGGTVFNEKLKTFLDALPGGDGKPVELHAAGHSAGSIFHAHLLRHAASIEMPAVQTLQLLAPAITVADFRSHFGTSLDANVVKDLTLYTMRKDLERADTCSPAYRKSLLYLIHYALEPKRKEPVLGLQESLLADREMAALFGLFGGTRPTNARVVWSDTTSGPLDGRSASRSHGGFDDDADTLNSVVRRVRNSDAILPYSPDGGGSDPRDLGPDGAPTNRSIGLENETTRPSRDVAADRPPAAFAGRRRALCVGVDRYPTAPLNGCVNDAVDWAGFFGRAGFDVRSLHNDAATRDGILGELRGLIGDSRAGDVIAFQYSGHGTSLPDLNGDEIGGDSPGYDEAIVPFDYQAGAYVIDDDLAEIFDTIPDGVNVTCFIDCCHSGTMNRLGVGPGVPAGDDRGTPRFIVADAAMEAAHRGFRTTRGLTKPASSRAAAVQREVLFAACLSTESAWETRGGGDFTRNAMKLFAEGLEGLTNQAFQDRVRAAFGTAPRQHPEMQCAADDADAGLLRPRGAGVSPTRQADVTSATATPSERQQILTIVSQLVAKL